MISSEAEAHRWLRDRDDYGALAKARLERFADLLLIANGSQNLISKASAGMIWRRHLADSVQLLDHVPRGTSPWIDLGSGAGLPGLVVAIMRPDIEVFLVESRPLRAAWLTEVSQALELTRVVVVPGRIETAQLPRAGAISARAVAPLPRLISLGARFSTSDTIWVLPKGRSAGHELTMLRDLDHVFHVEQSVTDPDAGIIVGRLLGHKGQRP